MMIGLGFFWFYFGFPTLSVRPMSTSVSSSSKCSLIAFKRILPVLCPCSSGIPWTRRQFLLVYCSRLSTSGFNCSCSFFRLKILLFVKELGNCIIRVWSLFCSIWVSTSKHFFTDSFGKLVYCLSALSAWCHIRGSLHKNL